MYKSRKDVSVTHNAAFNELYYANTLVKMIKSSCEDLEFRGEYYGMSIDGTKKLSAERNDCINMLTLISDRLTNLVDINLTIEKELLQQHTNYSSR